MLAAHPLLRHIAGACLCLMLLAPVAAQTATCPGDCNGDSEVTVNELILAVRIALGDTPVSSCTAADPDGSGDVTIADLINAVNAALNGCGGAIGPVTVRGRCRVPGAVGLTNCAAGTDVTMWRCDDQPICLSGPGGRTFLARTDVAVNGSFSFVVNGPDIQGKAISLEADLEGALIFRTLAFGPLGGGGGGGRDEVILEVEIDPASEGAVRAIEAAGFETVDRNDALQVIVDTRNDPRANFAKLTGADAADLAEKIAIELIHAGLGAVSAVAVSPDGLNVYAASVGDSTLSVFVRERGGNLRRVQLLHAVLGARDGLGAARDVAVSPDGRNVYVVGAADDAMAVFARNVDAEGALVPVQVLRDLENGVRGLGSPVDVEISGDGFSVYVADPRDNAVSVFRRNTQTGALGFVDAYANGFGNISGLGGAVALRVSDDGLHVFVAASTDAAVTAFQRSRTSGTLMLLDVESPVVQGVRVLERAAALALSSDGQDVYAAAAGGIAQLRRNPNGGLQFSTLYRPDQRSSDFSALAFSPDTDDLYVCAADGDSLSFLTRDPAQRGTLGVVTTFYDGAGEVDGLAEAFGIAISPDGLNVYAAGPGDDAIAIFVRNPNTGQISYRGVHR